MVTESGLTELIVVGLVRTVATAKLEELGTNRDDLKLDLYQSCQQKGPEPYPVKIPLSEFASPSLLDRAQGKLDVGGMVRQLKEQRIKSRGKTVYIPPQAKSSLQATGVSKFPLMKKVKEFLKGDQKVFLLLGDSGAGKSRFSYELEHDLWHKYKKKTDRIPLHINLPAIDKPEQDMITKQLRKAGFTESQIHEMKKKRKLILICDGYDECQVTQNLYMSNRLNQEGEWDTQMIIGCRIECLGTDYRDRFQPGDRNKRSDSPLFQEAVIMPFASDQIHSYIEQHVTTNQSSWRLEDYKREFDRIPTLMELVKNPFLMVLALEVLPHIVDQNLSDAPVTRVGLYDHFVKQWIERGKKRITEKDLTPQARTVFQRLTDEGFAQNGIDFVKKLAVAIYKEQRGRPIVEYSQLIDEGSWKDAFFLREDRQLLREACPITRNGNQHQFIHRSLLEYGLALSVFDPQDKKNITFSEPTKARRRSVSSIQSFESQDDFAYEASTPDEEPDINSPLVWRTLVNDHSLLEFLVERVKQEPLFKKRLLGYIECSKQDDKWRKAAANAITILVRAGVQFVGADLRGIRIPGADLSYGIFDSACLQDTDLRKVNFRGTWLRQADMSRAEMKGAQFGELPFLAEGYLVRSCAFSPDGKSLAVGLENGDISVYTTSSWERIRKWNGHSNFIWHVVYSPSGDQIASCSADTTVRLWDSETASLKHDLIDHGDWVRCVAYQPRGNLVVSASDDQTIRLWNKDTGECSQILSGHTGEVRSVACSPISQQIASGSLDRTVRLWNVETGNVIHTLSGHTLGVWAVEYSPRGDQVASASEDHTIRLWDVRTGVCRHVLSEHLNAVYCIVYSPKGDQLASGSVDGTVRLWDIESEQCRQILTGHNNTVFSVVYSPDGNRIASGGDTTVRLWDVSAGVTRFVSSGHSMVINSVDCSPGAELSASGSSSRESLIASGSSDRTIRLWDMETGACREIVSGHKNSVFCIAFSPQGDQLASGSSDRAVRLWDVKTGKCLSIFNGHDGWVECVVFSPQGNTIASASDDQTVILWDLEARQHKVLKGHTNLVLSVVYSTDGSQIATCSKDKSVRIWDTKTRECLQILVGHTDLVRDVAFSPQGDELASAGYDNTIRLWNVAEQKSRLILEGHEDKVRSIAYSHQGDLLASGSWDKTVRLWDVASGECRLVIRNIPGAINSVAWGTKSNADILVTGSKDGSVLKWKVTIEGEQCSVHLDWNTTNGTFTVTGASIGDARGLTKLNKQLLKQRGTIDEPENMSHESPWHLWSRARTRRTLEERCRHCNQSRF